MVQSLMTFITVKFKPADSYCTMEAVEHLGSYEISCDLWGKICTDKNLIIPVSFYDKNNSLA